MKIEYICLGFYLLSLLVNIQGRLCKNNEFKCFLDDNCIPKILVCNGKHDCFYGEDEFKGYANCQHCPGKFHCHKNPNFVECIEKEFMCDGFDDCLEGEDELYKFAKCEKACERNLLAAALVGRKNCRKPCTSVSQCKKGRVCKCDHECGMSCITPGKVCPKLNKGDNVRSIRYLLWDSGTRTLKDTKMPFHHDVQAHYECEPGYVALPHAVRYCHGRGVDLNYRWTKEITCAPSCATKKSSKIKEFKLTCGEDCLSNDDCAAGTVCTCDGWCGRTCVNLDVECGEAPPAKNAYIEYTGEKFDRVAHYICVEGTYTAAGDVSRKCTGSSKWDGRLIVCEKVYCGDPAQSISKMGGQIINYISPPHPFNTTFQFACGPGQRLLGSEFRTCIGNGQWSGVATVCDKTGLFSRCPHPGIPINGELKGLGEEGDFAVKKVVKFKCNEGYVMDGDEEQECLFFKQWSGEGAPKCVDPSYSDIPTDVINKLTQSTDNIREVKRNRAGRTVYASNPVGNEIYFLVDLSLSVGTVSLNNTLSFAQSLVRRLSFNGTADKVRYGIIVFASKPKLELNIMDYPAPKPKAVIKKLGEIGKKVQELRKIIKEGTNIQEALSFLDFHQLANSYIDESRNLMKRHVFILTDGMRNHGGDPSQARIDIENARRPNQPEFYSITSSAIDKNPEARQELKLLASKDKNFIYVEDFYKLHKYVDQVTDARIDFNVCGQAGRVGSVRKLARRGRVIGGDESASRAWPWQVLIMNFNSDVVQAFHSVQGGGSLINDRWVLTAAHVIKAIDDGSPGWESKMMLAMGIIRRPQKYFTLESSVSIFTADKVFTHDNYTDVYDYDIALVRLGAEYTTDGRIIRPVGGAPTGIVTFSPYIRPVCLPCSPDSCVAKVLKKPDQRGQVLLKGNETAEEKCRIEYEFLTSANEGEADVAMVVTGFGHNSTFGDLDERVIPSVHLKQGLLRLRNKETCELGVKTINRRRGDPDYQHIFTENMICATSGSDNRIIDSCKGDSGGPVVREVYDPATKKSCFVQLGIVSWGYGCGQLTEIKFKDFQYPGYYTDVRSMMAWITDTMKK